MRGKVAKKLRRALFGASGLSPRHRKYLLNRKTGKIVLDTEDAASRARAVYRKFKKAYRENAHLKKHRKN